MTGSAEAERLDRFFARANARYYATHDPFADFTTAPEITQVFGEILGLWAAVVWQSMGRPVPVVLAELGPGRGTLMADALRAIRSRAPAFRSALAVHLVETSAALRRAQAARVPDASWHATAMDLPRGPMLLLANEFLDALPIRQFVRRGGAWRERHVLDGAWAELPAASWPNGLPALSAVAEGGVAEIGEARAEAVAEIARRVSADGGAALFLDYGPERSAEGDSLQALRDGRPADPLADPGCSDLTAHVDFQAVAAAAREAGAAVFGPVPQGPFLVGLGLFQRSFALARGVPPREGAGLIEAARRLAEPDRMGRLFKALTVCHPAVPPPPGFEA